MVFTWECYCRGWGVRWIGNHKAGRARGSRPQWLWCGSVPKVQPAPGARSRPAFPQQWPCVVASILHSLGCVVQRWQTIAPVCHFLKLRACRCHPQTAPLHLSGPVLLYPEAPNQQISNLFIKWEIFPMYLFVIFSLSLCLPLSLFHSSSRSLSFSPSFSAFSVCATSDLPSYVTVYLLAYIINLPP